MATVASFKADWPEFASVPDTRVSAALVVGAARVDARLFDADEASLLEHVVCLYAASSLVPSPVLASQPRSLSALGTQERLASDNTSSNPYEALADKIMQARTGGPWLVGQGVDGGQR